MWFSRCALKGREDFKDALIHNISQTGVYLATDAPFDVGYQFAIEIDLPNDKGQIKGKCEVIWVNEIEAEDYPKGMGVQLVELEPKRSGASRRIPQRVGKRLNILPNHR